MVYQRFFFSIASTLSSNSVFSARSSAQRCFTSPSSAHFGCLVNARCLSARSTCSKTYKHLSAQFVRRACLLTAGQVHLWGPIAFWTRVWLSCLLHSPITELNAPLSLCSLLLHWCARLLCISTNSCPFSISFFPFLEQISQILFIGRNNVCSVPQT